MCCGDCKGLSNSENPTCFCYCCWFYFLTFNTLPLPAKSDRLVFWVQELAETLTLSSPEIQILSSLSQNWQISTLSCEIAAELTE